jgi:hypothetical protein
MGLFHTNQILFLVLENELLVLNSTRKKLISLGHGITNFNKNYGNGIDRQRNNGRTTIGRPHLRGDVHRIRPAPDKDIKLMKRFLYRKPNSGLLNRVGFFCQMRERSFFQTQTYPAILQLLINR